MSKIMDRGKSFERLGLLGAFLLALSLRLLSAKNALVGGDLLFYGYDSFYHMRRILYTAENFPSTLWFDSYLNHPSGLNITWPPSSTRSWPELPSSWVAALEPRR